MSIFLPINIPLKNNQILTIRSSRKNDAKSLIQYLNLVFTESDNLTRGMGEFNISVEEEKIIIDNYRKATNKIFLIGKIKSQIVSVLTCNASEKPRLKHVGVIGITVRKPFWNMGIGSTMMQSFINWVRIKSSLQKIDLAVRTDNEIAIKLYKKSGFLVEGTLRRELLIDGVYYDNYTMGLII